MAGRKQYDLAERAFKTILRIEPTHPNARLLIAENAQ
jgi:hypothetical protein